MTQARFVMVGGFLGAGKTTALARLARQFTEAGLRVGLITNDQAADLVDSGLLSVDGFHVEEIAGGCFCCKFDDLARAAERLRAEERPQIILGEPVGSCTDLVATVVNPLKKIYGEAYTVAPYTVLVDPIRAEQIFLEPGLGGLSSKVAYIYMKQIEEADAIVLNKIDLLDARRSDAILQALEREYPGKRLLRLSAISGEGFDAWVSLLEMQGTFGRSIVEVDYDTYAEGEAELGWLNATAPIEAREPFMGDDLVLELVSSLARSFSAAAVEPAHLKIMLADGRAAAVANLVRSGVDPVLSRAIGRPSCSGVVTINARVQADPQLIRRAVEAALEEVGRSRRLDLRLSSVSQFRPARPVPTHRETTPVL